MAHENYIRDISYLLFGQLSDLTLNFGDKTWQIHKALTVCHSKWFQKALTGGLRELESGVITLIDEPEYADAVDCIVSYFYEAGYKASKYNTSAALLHAQVAILADKYDCMSLKRLVKTLFTESAQIIESVEWRAVAAFVYDFTTTEASAHREIRNVVITTVKSRSYMMKSILLNGSVVDLLRSNADLATDLLLGRRYGTMAEDASKYYFVCDFCRYNHSGPQDSPNVNVTGDNNARTCPSCRKETGLRVAHYTRKIELHPAFPCSLCDGFHTHSLALHSWFANMLY